MISDILGIVWWIALTIFGLYIVGLAVFFMGQAFFNGKICNWIVPKNRILRWMAYGLVGLIFWPVMLTVAPIYLLYLLRPEILIVDLIKGEWWVLILLILLAEYVYFNFIIRPLHGYIHRRWPNFHI